MINNYVTYISVIVTIISIIFAIIQIKSQDYYIKFSKDKRKLILGKWKGKFIQNNDLKGEFYLNINSLKTVIKGKIRIRSLSDSIRLESDMFLEFTGGFLNNRFLKIEFINDANILQFGYFILELNPLLDELNGKFVAFGPYSRTIISGDVIFIKENE